MTYEEVYNELCRLSSLGASSGDIAFTEQEREWLDTVSRSETGEPVRQCSCKNRYADAAVELRRILKMRKALMAERKYDLRRGDIVWYDGRPYSTLSLTDEIAEAVIREHPDAIDRFIVNESASRQNPTKNAQEK